MNVSKLLQESEKSENFFKKMGRAFSTFQQNLYIVGFGQFTPGFPQFQHGFPHFNGGMMWKTCAKCKGNTAQFPPERCLELCGIAQILCQTARRGGTFCDSFKVVSHAVHF
jgi:hypothetical protein